MQDPVDFAVVVAAASDLGGKVIAGTASAAGKDLWTRIRRFFPWGKVPDADELARAIATEFVKNPELLGAVRVQLAARPEIPSARMVNQVNAKNAVVAERIEGGSFRLS